MQGILKSNHQKLCDSLQGVKVMQPDPDHKLNELEDELHSAFKSYQQKMNELKRIINIYDEKQKTIKNEIKRIRKYSIVISKKMEKRVLSKLMILIILAVYKVFVSMEVGAVFSAVFC